MYISSEKCQLKSLKNFKSRFLFELSGKLAKAKKFDDTESLKMLHLKGIDLISKKTLSQIKQHTL